MSRFSHIPKVDRVLQWPEVKTLLDHFPRPVLIQAVRKVLDEIRSEAVAGGELSGIPEAAVADRIRKLVTTSESPRLRRVINGTGVVIHTNLGRSPLPEAALKAIESIASGYSNLEFDLTEGVRGSRYVHVENLLCELTGAEAALVANNNAAALLLALAALASGREVVVSRGELVEIGGSFRIPDIMRQSGGVLREIGTTNRTHLHDYREAINAETALLLKVHCSNFAVVGFTTEVSAAELVLLGREHALPVMVDAGSGNLLERSALHAYREPSVQEYLRAGADLVSFSGDKLLGGPQAGMIVGSRRLIDLLRKHPLLRALRIDKLSLAALEATLRLYRDERQALSHIPTLQMLTVSREVLAKRGRAFLRRARKVLPPAVEVSLAEGVSQAGGGALPLAQLPTVLLVVKRHGSSSQEVEQRLRSNDIPIIGRIAKGDFLLDLRTIFLREEKELLAALCLLGT